MVEGISKWCKWVLHLPALEKRSRQTDTNPFLFESPLSDKHFLSWPMKAPKIALTSFIYIKKCQPGRTMRLSHGNQELQNWVGVSGLMKFPHGFFWCIWSTMTVLLPPPEGPTNPADVPASRTKDTPLRTSRLHGNIMGSSFECLYGHHEPLRFLEVCQKHFRIC